MVDRLAAVALAIEARDRQRFRSLPGRLNGEGGAWRQEWVVAVGERQRTLSAQRGPDGVLSIGPHEKTQPVVSDWRPGEPVWAGKVGRHAMIVQVRRNPAGLRAFVSRGHGHGAGDGAARGGACRAGAAEAGGRRFQGAALPDAGAGREDRRRRRADGAGPARSSPWWKR